MRSIFKWLRRRYWLIRSYPAHRRYRRAQETQQQMFMRWAMEPSRDIRQDDWEDAKALVDYDLGLRAKYRRVSQ